MVECPFGSVMRDAAGCAQGKELWWNEYGVGGGASQDGNTPAKTAEQAAATPFFGVFGGYVKARDPWQTPQVKDYNHYFYRQTLAYLDSRGVSPCSPVLLCHRSVEDLCICCCWI